MNKSNIGWRVLFVKTQHEKKINNLLKDYGIESFLPCVNHIVQWSDRKKKVNKPLFPSYVFINVDCQKQFYKALAINGVLKCLRFGENYASVKDDEISRVKQILSLEGISNIEALGYLPPIQKKMVINYGALSGLNCEVVRMNNKNKCKSSDKSGLI